MQWITGKQKSLAFGIPIVWKDPIGHGKECLATFAHALLMGAMLKLSINILIYLVPCDLFLIGQVSQFHCL